MSVLFSLAKVEKFQMWNPEDFNEFKRDAKIKALENRNLIGPSHIDKLSKEVLD